MKQFMLFILMLAAFTSNAADSTVVYFKYNTAVMINPESLENIQGVVTRVEGSTCMLGNADDNLALSKRRVSAVMKRINNFDSSVVVVAYGEEKATTNTVVDRKVVIYWEAAHTITVPVVGTINVDNAVIDTTTVDTVTVEDLVLDTVQVTTLTVDTNSIVEFMDTTVVDSVFKFTEGTGYKVFVDNAPNTKEQKLDSFFLNSDASCGCGDMSDVTWEQVRYYNALGARANTVNESICAAFCYAKARRLLDGYWSEKATKAAKAYTTKVRKVNARKSRGGKVGSGKRTGLTKWQKIVLWFNPFAYCK